MAQFLLYKWAQKTSQMVCTGQRDVVESTAMAMQEVMDVTKHLMAVVAALAFAGCASMTPVQQGAGLGALAGGAVGAAIGGPAGGVTAGEGAAIGAAVGAAAGALIGDAMGVPGYQAAPAPCPPQTVYAPPATPPKQYYSEGRPIEK